jgi:hypothetical protein
MTGKTSRAPILATGLDLLILQHNKLKSYAFKDLGAPSGSWPGAGCRGLRGIRVGLRRNPNQEPGSGHIKVIFASAAPGPALSGPLKDARPGEVAANGLDPAAVDPEVEIASAGCRTHGDFPSLRPQVELNIVREAKNPAAKDGVQIKR